MVGFSPVSRQSLSCLSLGSLLSLSLVSSKGIATVSHFRLVSFDGMWKKHVNNSTCNFDLLSHTNVEKPCWTLLLQTWIVYIWFWPFVVIVLYLNDQFPSSWLVVLLFNIVSGIELLQLLQSKLVLTILTRDNHVARASGATCTIWSPVTARTAANK